MMVLSDFAGFFKYPISFFTDPRLPLYYPINRSRWGALSSRIDGIRLGDKPSLDFVFTMDMEYDYGSGGHHTTKYILPFLELANGFFRKEEIKSTLFIQGDLVGQAAGALKALGPQHEIGLHGYAHEPWGVSWFVKDPVPSVSERQALLSRSLSAFKDAGFEQPQSFRAPNMVIDKLSMELLREAGFTADSSFPSYSGGIPTLSAMHGLAEIPVSFDPKPSFGKSLRARYIVFNTHNLATGELKICDAAMRVAKAQKLSGQKPFIVFLGHPWEFFTPDMGPGDPSFGYSSPKNLSLLRRAISELKESFTLNPMTMAELRRSRL